MWQKRPYGQELPEAGKLETPCAKDRAQEGGKDMVRSIPISSVAPAGGYRIEGAVNGTRTSFLLDTGAAVTLLREDAWARCNAKHNLNLQPWSEQRLVSVDGSPLRVHGLGSVDLDFAGEKLPAEVIVVSPLTTEAILGLDFLCKHRATIDLEKRQLYLGDRRCTLPLCEPNPRVPDLKPSVRALETFDIPPYSEMEVQACLQEPVTEGAWLLEGAEGKRLPASVARALVQPTNDRVPVRLLNPRPGSIRVHRGMEIATLEAVDTPPTTDAVIANVTSDEVLKEKREMLWSLAENGETEHSGGEEKFFQLLLKYSHVFVSSSRDLGRTDHLRHCIPTGDAPPVRQAVRRIPPHRRTVVQNLLDDMLQKDVIQPSSSPWAAPIVLVQKKDGSTRFCVDYRKMNEVTRKEAYPLPRIDATLDTLAGSQWFSTLDMLSGYWQVEVDEPDRPKTAFCTTEGLFEFKVMPFGLCNAPATFQRLMDLRASHACYCMYCQK